MAEESKKTLSIWPIAITIMFMGLLYFGSGVLKQSKEVSIRVVTNEVEVVKEVVKEVPPPINIPRAVISSTESLTRVQKLVVLQASIAVLVREQVAASLFGLPSGSSEVWMEATNNRVQFFVPLDQLSTNNFHYVEANKVLSVDIPTPVLDTDMISVQSNPTLRTFNGSLVSLNGNKAAQEAKDLASRMLKVSVAKEARKWIYGYAAELAAKEAVLKLIQSFAIPMGVTVDVRLEGAATKAASKSP